MPQKRRHIRRSREQSEALLRSAVAQLLRERGYDALTATAIERVSGISRKKINEQFGGKAAVIRGYLTDTDFWLPRLRQVVVTQQPKSIEVLRHFTQLLQDQFREFLANQELRHVILAQITNPDPLMRTINSMREAEGQRVIAMAEAHFRDTGIDLNWVIGLVLGGCYFYGLQGDTGNGPALGRDVRNERDVAGALRTIGQMLELFWWAADRNRKGKLKHRYFKLTSTR